LGMGFLISSHFIYRRISYIMYRILMFRFKKLHFKGKYGEEFIHIAFDILDAILLPCPYFGRDIIKYRNLRASMNKLGYIQVEARIVHQYKYIRLPGHNILLTAFHIGENSAQVQQDGNEAHICQFLIMLHQGSAYRRH